MHQKLLELAGRAPDAWLVIARETLAAGDIADLDRLIAALDTSRTSPGRCLFTPEPAGHEDADGALVEAVRAAGEVLACWAVTRDGADRVYLVQADGDLPAITVAGQRALTGRAPLVEVFAGDEPLPDYHEQALLAATLLWSVTDDPPVTVAGVFDGADGNGPWFAPEHELVADRGHRRALLDFLTSGEVVLHTDTVLPDVVAGTPGPVPASLRSDGVWVWSDASAYYLDRHHLAPESALADHAEVAAPGGRLTPLTRHHVRAALSIDLEGPTWPAG
jgi:hypothetical protein